MEALADADLVLVVLDASQPTSEEDKELLKQVENRAAITVANKADLPSSQFSAPSSRPEQGSDSFIHTSALTGEGIASLREAILQHVGGGGAGLSESGVLTNLRHQKLVQDSLVALAAARDAVANKIPHEMLLLDLYNALHQLDEITGATTTDDILGLIFSTFCIGK
jgi:tRNA modification GTPase